MVRLPASGRLRREIVFVLALKIVGLALLYVLFFAPGQRVAVDAGSMQALLTAAAGPQR